MVYTRIILGIDLYDFTFSDSFNPAQEGMNGDIRNLTILIVSVIDE